MKNFKDLEELLRYADTLTDEKLYGWNSFETEADRLSDGFFSEVAGWYYTGDMSTDDIINEYKDRKGE